MYRLLKHLHSAWVRRATRLTNMEAGAHEAGVHDSFSSAKYQYSVNREQI